MILSELAANEGVESGYRTDSMAIRRGMKRVSKHAVLFEKQP